MKSTAAFLFSLLCLTLALVGVVADNREPARTLTILADHRDQYDEVTLAWCTVVNGFSKTEGKDMFHCDYSTACLVKARGTRSGARSLFHQRCLDLKGSYQEPPP